MREASRNGDVPQRKEEREKREKLAIRGCEAGKGKDVVVLVMKRTLRS